MSSGPAERAFRTGWKLVLLCLALVLGAGLAARPAAADGREYQLKAAFLYNFAKFVEWPSQALEGPNLVIVIAGKEAYDAAVQTIQGKAVRGKTVQVRQYTGTSSLENCHILFISAPENSRFRAIADQARSTNILTVGEAAGFARSGGVINFTTSANKIRFEINPTAAERARLSISSQLLQLAKIVRA